jgi:hypothetical protein
MPSVPSGRFVGFVVTAQLFDDESGEWWLGIETTEDRAWCDACAVRRVSTFLRQVCSGITVS